MGRYLLLILSLIVIFPFLTLAAPSEPHNSKPEIETILNLPKEEFLRAVSDQLFQSAINKQPIPVADLWRLADKMQTYKDESGILIAYGFGQLLKQIVEQGNDDDFQRMLQLQDSFVKEIHWRRVVLDKLCDMQLKREIDALVANNQAINLELTESTEPLPAELQNISGELQTCWRRFKSFYKTPDKDSAIKDTSIKDDGEKIEFITNMGLFYHYVAEFLKGSSSDAFAKLSQFKWGSHCGTGASLFTEPRDKVWLLAALKEQRYSNALAIWLKNDDKEHEKLLRQFLSLCQQDWQQLYIGAILDNERALIEPLVKQGTDESARLMLKMSTIPKFTNDHTYINGLAALVKPGKTESFYGVGSSADIIRESTNEIAADIQLQILQFIGDKIKADTPLSTLNLCTHLFARLNRPESIPALRRAVAMPYKDVHYAAATALRAMGEPEVKSKHNYEPVKFQLLINSKPVCDQDIDFELNTGNSHQLSSGVKTDEKGQFKLDRDLLIHPKEKIERIYFGTRPKQLTDLHFILELAKPTNLDQLLNLNIQSTRLKIDLIANRPLTSSTSEMMSVKLQRVAKENNGCLLMGRYSEAIKVSLNAEIVFPFVQYGDYQIEISVPGYDNWHSEVITIDQSATTVTAQLVSQDREEDKENKARQDK